MNVLQHCTLKCFAAAGEKNDGDLECFFPLLLSYQFFLILPLNTGLYAYGFSDVLLYPVTQVTCGTVVTFSKSLLKKEIIRFIHNFD